MDPDNLADLIARDAGLGIPELEPRDYAVLLLPDLDYDAQLVAIRELLAGQAETEKVLARRLRNLEEDARSHVGLHSHQALDEWMERVHASVYQDAAHSMAAVGMLAPFAESLFYQVFIRLGKMWSESAVPLPLHPRFHPVGEKTWDCHFVPYNNGKWGKDLPVGIRQLADATGLTSVLPRDLWLRLAALFGYRNKMFHNGFEWPSEQRRKFAERASKEWPPEWFRWATSGGEPWIAYMEESFVRDTLKSLEGVLEGLGRFAMDLHVRLAAP
ncbi:MAG TPA: hypothetical protein VF092_18055 [Longimicrobium sp.]